MQIKDYPVQPVPFTQVRMNDGFWAPRIETNRTVTIPFAFEQCEKNRRMYNFERAAAAVRGEEVKDRQPPELPFDDTDPFKVIEGAAYAMAVQPDPKLDAYVDTLIEQIAAAQEPDGYLFTARTIAPENPHPWAGPERWVLERELSHELYNFGHLYEAAAAHYQATGKRSLLDVAIKTADLLDRTFGPGKQTVWPGHQITEMGLIKLYRVTGEERYLNLAKFLLDVRGPDGHKGAGREYNQSHQPVVEQTDAVGHAVRATYMYAGMADVAAITGDASYIKAIDAIWDNCVGRKLYITGGIGAKHDGEAFGRDFELPNMTAYNETCAAIGNVYWNHRLFLLHADAKYIDVLERTLYNGLISGVSLDGKGFFYPNPLESKGQHERKPWFGCACCPSNICRFMASIPGYVYARRNDEVFVNLFAGGTGEVDLGGGRSVELTQETHYPWDGLVKIRVTPSGAGAFALNVRIPGWARNEPTPGGLYRFFESSAEQATLKINGQSVPLDVKNGYVALRREWKAGDTIELNLPMPVRRVLTRDEVVADRGRVALERGPIVYCAEWPDHPGAHVRTLLLDDKSVVTPVEKPELLGSVVALTSKVKTHALAKDGSVTASDTDLLAIPYYAWSHRGRGEMAVWLAREPSAVRTAPPPTIASMSKISVSKGATDPISIIDGRSSLQPGEEKTGVLHWWPKKATTEWVEYTFAEPERVTSSSVFWFDDTGHGDCRVPKSWRLFYKDTSAGSAGAWRPVSLTGGTAYGSTKDAFNTVTFEPVTTPGLRLEVDLPDDWSTGIEEWQVK
ncbi:MAG: glycoside hydrolase family 127 protein [Tepidisphaeraceae bacterium]